MSTNIVYNHKIKQYNEQYYQYREIFLQFYSNIVNIVQYCSYMSIYVNICRYCTRNCAGLVCRCPERYAALKLAAESQTPSSVLVARRRSGTVTAAVTVPASHESAARAVGDCHGLLEVPRPAGVACHWQPESRWECAARGESLPVASSS